MAVIFFASGVALAQGKEQKPLSESLSGEAKAAYDGAVLLYQDNDFDGASAKFARAYDLSKDARLLWNMATCEKGARRYFKTHALIDRYLKEGASSISMEAVARAEETKHVLRDLFSPVQLHVVPESARVTENGQPLPDGLDLGAHRVRVEAPGYQPEERVIDVPGKTAVVIDVTLKRVIAPARLSVVTETSALVRVDGQSSTGQWEGPLAPGKHKIEITAQGKVPYFTEVDLGEGASRSMLVPLKEKAGVPAWVWIGGGVVLAAGAALTIGLVVKANETPPPLTGKLGTINLSSF